MSGDNLAQTCNVVIGEQVAGWKTFRSQRSAFNRDTTTALRRLRNHLCDCVSWGAERQLYLSVKNNPLSVFLNRTSCSFLYLGLYDKPACKAIRSQQVKVRKQLAGCTWDKRWHGCGWVLTRTYKITAKHLYSILCQWVSERDDDIRKYFCNIMLQPTFSVIVCEMWAIYLSWGWRTTLLWLFHFWWKWENKQ